MQEEILECITLNPDKYVPSTKKWDVPLLRLPGVTLEEVHIDGMQLLKNSEYTHTGNHLTLLKPIQVTKGTKAAAVIKFNLQNTLLLFWLPIILAMIAFAGAVAQPILHSMNLLYVSEKPEMNIYHRSWVYSPDHHKWSSELLINNLKPEDKEAWKIHLVVRKFSNQIDASHHKFKYVSDPFNLEEIMEIGVLTSPEFTELARQPKSSIEGCILQVKRRLKIGPGFILGEHSENDAKLFGGTRIAYD